MTRDGKRLCIQAYRRACLKPTVFPEESNSEKKIAVTAFYCATAQSMKTRNTFALLVIEVIDNVSRNERCDLFVVVTISHRCHIGIDIHLIVICIVAFTA